MCFILSAGKSMSACHFFYIVASVKMCFMHVTDFSLLHRKYISYASITSGFSHSEKTKFNTLGKGSAINLHTIILFHAIASETVIMHSHFVNEWFTLWLYQQTGAIDWYVCEQINS